MESLRNKAIEILKNQNSGTDNLSKIEMQNLIEELQIHQIELQLQNEELQQSRISIEESNRKYFNLFDLAPVAYLLLDTKGIITDCNLKTTEILERSKLYTIQRTFVSMLYPESITKFYDYFDSIKENKNANTIELEIKIGGNKKIIQLIITEYNNEKYLCVLTDITEKKQNAEKLAAIQNRFQNFFQSQATGIVVSDMKGQFFEVNQKFCDIIEYTKAELLKMSYLDVTHQEDIKEDFENAQLVKQGLINNYNIRKRYITKTGKVVWGNLTITGVKENNVLKYLIGNIIDITEHVKNEIRLKESEELHREVLSNITDAVFITDKDDNFTYICPNIENIFGYTNQEISQLKKITDIFGKILIDKKLLETQEEIFNIDLQITNKRGEIIDLLINVKNVNIVTGKILYTCRNISQRKFAEMKLLDSESKFRSIFENSNNAIFLLNREGKYMEINKAYTNITGYNRSDFLSQTAGFITHPEDKDYVVHKLKQLISGKIHELSREIRILHKNGQTIWIALHTSVHYNQIGDFQYLLGNFYDITQQKNIAAIIKKSEERYRQLFEFMPVGISLADHQGKLILSNKAATQMLGIEQDEHNNRKIDSKQWQIIRKDGTPMQTAEFASTRALNENRLIENVEMGIVKEEDTIVWLNVNAIPNKNDSGIIISYVDITEKIEREKKLISYYEDLKKFSFAVEQSPTTVVITDLEGNIVYANKKFTELTGYTLDEVKSKNPKILKSRKTAPEVYNKLWLTIKSGKMWKGELINLKKNGEEFVENILIAPVFDYYGKVINYIAVKEDITERKRQEEIIRLSNLKLEESNATKDRFFSIIAHDLRNPFSAILGFSELLMRNFDKYDKVKVLNFINNIHTATKNTYKLLENLLEWAQIQRDAMVFKLEKIKLNTLIQEQVEVLTEQAKNKAIDISYNCEENIYIAADRNMITTVVRNLISNALKFTNKGGEVKIKATTDNEKTILTVTDNGIGMDETTKNNLFKFDSNQSRRGTANESGTGLGLVLCKEFINKHNGNILVRTEINKGTEFEIILPNN